VTTGRRRLSEILPILLRWGTFTVGISVMPVVFNALAAYTRGQPVRYVDLVANGELLLVSVAISAAAVGELAVGIGPWASGKVLLMAMSLFTSILAAWWFADVTAVARAHDPVDRHAIAVGSTWVFASALVVGACCIFASRMTP